MAPAEPRSSEPDTFAAVGLSVSLLAWSLVANLGLGDRLYVTRNLVLVLVLASLARRLGMTRDELGLHPHFAPAGIRVGLTSAVVVAVVLVVALLVRDRLPVVEVLLADQRAALASRELLLATLVRIPLGTALFEEVAFRGVLLGSWRRLRPERSAVLVSSTVFGLWHVAPTLVALEINGVAPASAPGLGALAGAVVVTTIGGMVFAWLRLVSGSLLAAVLAHWATNALGLVAASRGETLIGS